MERPREVREFAAGRHFDIHFLMLLN